VAVEAHLDTGQRRADGVDPGRSLGRGEGAGGVGDVHDLGAGVGHDPGLIGQPLGAVLVGHHEEADRGHAELPGQGEVLGGDVGLGAMRGDPHERRPEVAGPAQVALGPDARQQQDGHAACREHFDGGSDEGLLVDQRPAVVERRAAQPVAVADLDVGDPGFVQRGGHRLDVVDRELVRLGVAAVSQGRVDDHDTRHQPTPSRWLLRASSSPTRVAAAVMMSRLPA
jgi:hypothetical protein